MLLITKFFNLWSLHCQLLHQTGRLCIFVIGGIYPKRVCSRNSLVEKLNDLFLFEKIGVLETKYPENDIKLEGKQRLKINLFSLNFGQIA